MPFETKQNKTKWSQNKDIRNMILQGQALTCTASEKSFRLKGLSNLTTSFSPETWLSQEILTLPVVVNRFSPFGEASCAKFLDICSFSDREILLWAPWQGESTQKGVDIGRPKGQVYRCLWHLLPFCAGAYRWQSGKPTFQWFNNMKPKSNHESSWEIRLWSNRGLQEMYKEETPRTRQVTSFVQVTSFMYINSNLFLTSFKYPPRLFCRQP